MKNHSIKLKGLRWQIQDKKKLLYYLLLIMLLSAVCFGISENLTEFSFIFLGGVLGILMSSVRTLVTVMQVSKDDGERIQKMLSVHWAARKDGWSTIFSPKKLNFMSFSSENVVLDAKGEDRYVRGQYATLRKIRDALDRSISV